MWGKGCRTCFHLNFMKSNQSFSVSLSFGFPSRLQIDNFTVWVTSWSELIFTLTLGEKRRAESNGKETRKNFWSYKNPPTNDGVNKQRKTRIFPLWRSFFHSLFLPCFFSPPRHNPFFKSSTHFSWQTFTQSAFSKRRRWSGAVKFVWKNFWPFCRRWGVREIESGRVWT